MRKLTGIVAVLFAILILAASCASPPPPAPAPAPPPPAAPPPPPPAPGAETTPQVNATFSARYFNPYDGDLVITLSVIDQTAITSWRVEINEPQAPYHLFHSWEGQGQPPAQLRWNGRGRGGEMIMSALDYPFAFTATNAQGNTGTFQTLLGVDVFVVRDGPNLRIQVPSIIFAANSGGWAGVEPEISAANEFILRRIAQVLSRFPAYQVRVEGHANATINPNDTAARQQEEALELRPLSELRAATVMNYLVRLGIDSGRLSYFGIGGERPMADWDDRTNWWKNRRVEFLLVR